MRKIISIVVIMSLLITSQPAQANFFTDLFGGLFTVVSYPFQLLLGSTKAPFFVSQNPFVEKEWYKEERLAVGRKPQELPSSTSIPQQPDTKASEGNPADTVSPAPTPTPSLSASIEAELNGEQQMGKMGVILASVAGVIVAIVLCIIGWTSPYEEPKDDSSPDEDVSDDGFYTSEDIFRRELEGAEVLAVARGG